MLFVTYLPELGLNSVWNVKCEMYMVSVHGACIFKLGMHTEAHLHGCIIYVRMLCVCNTIIHACPFLNKVEATALERHVDYIKGC